MFEFHIVESDLSLFLTQYIFCISLRIKKNTFSPLLRSQKTSHSFNLVANLVFDIALTSFYLDFVRITSHATWTSQYRHRTIVNSFISHPTLLEGLLATSHY